MIAKKSRALLKGGLNQDLGTVEEVESVADSEAFAPDIIEKNHGDIGHQIIAEMVYE